MQRRIFLAACFLLFLVPGPAAPAARAQGFAKDFTVEAYVDGPSELHIRRDGIYWVNRGNAKPGRLGAKNEPTYINGKPWTPRWKNNDSDRGDDRSNVFAMMLNTIEFDFELLAVSKERGGTAKDERKPLEVKRAGGELVITVPDPESGARWYKIQLRERKK